ncbi:MAG TPA: zinc metallopeptidase [Bacteroidia bacterium]|nr:zinc metallopeptidase [Bacteroidia bacterium]
MFYDPVYMAIVVVFLLAGFIVQARLRSVFSRYGQIPLRLGLTGKQVAERMLRDNAISDVKVMSAEGRLTDHYNPAEKTINLSPDVYNGATISAAAVAAHECGHAVQHATGYQALQLRSKLVPFVQFASMAMNFIYIAMIFLAFSYALVNQALLVIIIAQSVVTLFALITLPVEFDASRRALAWLKNTGVSYGEEQEKAETALRWAAMTYLVAALAAVAQLLYFIMRFSGRRE